MPRWVGLLGSWALLVLGVGLALYAGASEAITVSDARRLQKVRIIDELMEERAAQQLQNLKQSMSGAASSLNTLQSEAVSTEKLIDDLHDSDLVITVSTAENKVYARRAGKLVFEGVCSTGKNTTLREGGRTMVFRTPIGKFRIRSKEESPMWVPPDWHYIEEAKENGMRVVRLERGRSVGGLYVSGKNVYSNGYALPAGEMIYRGGAVVIPPVGTRQRQFDKVLGSHRLNLGDGYALHGTQQVRQLGRSVSHGCVRLHNRDIERLYQMAKVGDEVIIY